ncbi:hypothetical protein F511_03963 [Dorcoceras hygrometricum]|uniref:Uncharacterized protein n=1 Tax=Dorcoceras hygrometricum TaxID=472368 RepID=A0A2Z7B7L7_9LAMI|nr:hypothetical protein F511_03963 [Dorcoceras hygrometricum]
MTCAKIPPSSAAVQKKNNLEKVHLNDPAVGQRCAEIQPRDILAQNVRIACKDCKHPEILYTASMGVFLHTDDRKWIGTTTARTARPEELEPDFFLYYWPRGLNLCVQIVGMAAGAAEMTARIGKTVPPKLWDEKIKGSKRTVHSWTSEIGVVTKNVRECEYPAARSHMVPDQYRTEQGWPQHHVVMEASWKGELNATTLALIGVIYHRQSEEIDHVAIDNSGLKAGSSSDLSTTPDLDSTLYQIWTPPNDVAQEPTLPAVHLIEELGRCSSYNSEGTPKLVEQRTSKLERYRFTELKFSKGCDEINEESSNSIKPTNVLNDKGHKEFLRLLVVGVGCSVGRCNQSLLVESFPIAEERETLSNIRVQFELFPHDFNSLLNLYLGALTFKNTELLQLKIDGTRLLALNQLAELLVQIHSDLVSQVACCFSNS